jgi:phosphatidate phosphatase APP1
MSRLRNKCAAFFFYQEDETKSPSETTARYVSKLPNTTSQHLVTYLIIIAVRTLPYIPLLYGKVLGKQNSSGLAQKHGTQKNYIVCCTNKFNFPIPNIINKKYLNFWVRSKQVHSP